MVLSPPRHGKTALLIHFCVWLIVRNPDIRILWVAKSEEMAEDMVGSVKDELLNNTELIEAFLGPERRYKPKRGGWGRLKFRVANRTVTGRVASTMVFLTTRSSSFKFGPASLGRNLGFSGAAIPLAERAAPVG